MRLPIPPSHHSPLPPRTPSQDRQCGPRFVAEQNIAHTAYLLYLVIRLPFFVAPPLPTFPASAKRPVGPSGPQLPPKSLQTGPHGGLPSRPGPRPAAKSCLSFFAPVCGSNHACPFLLLRLCLSFFAVPLAAVLGAVGGPIAGCPFRCAAGSGNLTGSFAIRVSLPWVQPHDWLRTERWRQPAGVSPRGEIGPPAPRL